MESPVNDIRERLQETLAAEAFKAAVRDTKRKDEYAIRTRSWNTH